MIVFLEDDTTRGWPFWKKSFSTAATFTFYYHFVSYLLFEIIDHFYIHFISSMYPQRVNRNQNDLCLDTIAMNTLLYFYFLFNVKIRLSKENALKGNYFCKHIDPILTRIVFRT